MESVSNNQAVGAVGRMIDQTKGLSVEGLLLVCQSRMSDIDSDVKRRLQMQQDRGNLQAKISDTLAKLKGLTGGEITDSADTVNALAAELDQEIALAEKTGDTAAADSLRAAKGKLTEDLHGGVDGKCSKDDIESVKQSLDSAVKSCGTNSELEMIDIQQLMSKRAQLLQLTTNMLNSANESTKAAIGNIR